ncbi:LysR family transcriptional regulator [Rhizorhapis sp. SPR117]|uniref:LysR family transcriptional regulator n=1 Tax=Rhizorhapis sp. SPR117 TaxID=2912611 RepID=UPI001F3EDA7C|nr:LysR family transcriptional regulator [Rhizorhapis sp. SPR117]
MIDRYLLRYFLAVVDCGTFSRAASHSNVTQPTLSVGIAKLETELGTTLFFRSSQRVHLTEAGAKLVPYARRIEAEFNQAAAAMTGHESARITRVGLLSTINTTTMTQVVEALRHDNVHDQIEIIDGNERELNQQLMRGRIDIALSIVRADDNRFLGEVLKTEGYAMALPLDHPLARQKILQPESLANDVMIVRRNCEVLADTSRYFTERGIRPFFAYRTTNDERVSAFVRAGLGITLMPESHAGAGIVLVPLAGFTLTRSIGILYASHAETLYENPSPIIAAIRQMV